jgi:hypothetical protein
LALFMSQGAEFTVKVECSAGHRGELTPRRFSFGHRPIEVAEVLDAWLAPDHRYFKVRGNDRACYILRNDVVAGRWQLTCMTERVSLADVAIKSIVKRRRPKVRGAFHGIDVCNRAESGHPLPVAQCRRSAITGQGALRSWKPPAGNRGGLLSAGKPTVLEGHANGAPA